MGKNSLTSLIHINTIELPTLSVTNFNNSWKYNFLLYYNCGEGAYLFYLIIITEYKNLDNAKMAFNHLLIICLCAYMCARMFVFLIIYIEIS